MLRVGVALSVGAWTSAAGGVPTTFSDDFNRPNENLEASPSWERVGGAAGAAAVSSNALAFVSTTETLYLCPDLGAVDHYVQGTRRTSFNKPHWDIVLRAADINNFVGARHDSDVWQVYKRVAGTYTQVGANAADNAEIGDVMRMEAVGDDVRLLINGEVVLDWTSLGGDLGGNTRAGVCPRTQATGAALDDFSHGLIATSILLLAGGSQLATVGGDLIGVLI